MSLVLLSTSFIAMYQTSIAFTTSGTNLNTEAITLMNEGRVQVKIRESNTLSAVKNCSGFPIHEWHDSYIGVKLAMPEWEAILTTIVLAVIIVLTIIGNILVILSVFTYKPLRIVQNVFIVSLAVADLTVALLVLPFNVGYYILGRWEFGIIMCKLWLTCDIMCCTSSILNLCAIALDRYWAITDPINYAQKRTVQRVMFLITGVWMLSLFISSPPLLGWNDWPNEFTSASRCELNSNPSYIAYSSLGSFFIPLIIMACVYVKIYIATRRRIRERAETNALAKRLGTTETNENGVKNVSTLCRVTLWFCRQFSSFSVTPTMHNNNSSEINNDPECTQAVQDDIDIITVRRKNTHIPNIKDAIIHGNPRALEYDRDVSINMQHLRNVNFERCINKTNDNMTGGNDNEKTLLKIVPTQSSKSVHHFIKEKQKISLSKERRAARTLGIIMGVFVICWLPFFLMYVILPFCATCCLTTKFKNFITWLGYINSVLNPIIYTIFNLDYRRSFKRLLGLN